MNEDIITYILQTIFLVLITVILHKISVSFNTTVNKKSEKRN